MDRRKELRTGILAAFVLSERSSVAEPSEHRLDGEATLISKFFLRSNSQSPQAAANPDACLLPAHQANAL